VRGGELHPERRPDERSDDRPCRRCPRGEVLAVGTQALLLRRVPRAVEPPDVRPPSHTETPPSDSPTDAAIASGLLPCAPRTRALDCHPLMRDWQNTRLGAHGQYGT